MLETLPFDPADYLDSEEGFQAYLDDARLDGPEAFADAISVVARARARLADREHPKGVAPVERSRRAS